MHMMLEPQMEARLAALSVEPPEALVARLVRAELEVPAWAALVEPLVPADQMEVEELLAALELVARPVPLPYAH
jgi:hypothetical protein